MGPTCEVIFETPLNGDALRAVDLLLSKVAQQVERTRKGRVWDVSIRGRPVHVAASASEPEIILAAGYNSSEDYDILRWLGHTIADMLDGLASEPVK